MYSQSKFIHITCTCIFPVCRMLWDGSDYVGQLNYTITNRQCADWSGGNLPTMIDSDGGIVEYDEQHNYCRNPTRTGNSPWCYVQSVDGGFVAENCEVPMCGKLHFPFSIKLIHLNLNKTQTSICLPYLT